MPDTFTRAKSPGRYRFDTHMGFLEVYRQAVPARLRRLAKSNIGHCATIAANAEADSDLEIAADILAEVRAMYAFLDDRPEVELCDTLSRAIAAYRTSHDREDGAGIVAAALRAGGAILDDLPNRMF